MNNEQKDRLVSDYIAEVQPSNPESHVLAFAYCKVNFECSQALYSKHAGFSDRGLREYISKNREMYDAEVIKLEEDKEKPFDMTNISSRALTEAQLDKFIEVLYQSAIKGNARDRQLLIDFSGLTATDVMNLTEVKTKSLRHWVKSHLKTIKHYLNVKTLGLMTESSKYIYRGDKKSGKNPQRYINAKLTDEDFKRELMYWGAVHLNLLNNVEHPETELLATAVRIDRISAGESEEFNIHAVKRYAKGKNISPDKKSSGSIEHLRGKLIETLGEDKAVEAIATFRLSKNTVKPPEFESVDVQQRASQYEDELILLLSTEEEISYMLKNQLKNRKGE